MISRQQSGVLVDELQRHITSCLSHNTQDIIPDTDNLKERRTDVAQVFNSLLASRQDGTAEEHSRGRLLTS